MRSISPYDAREGELFPAFREFRGGCETGPRYRDGDEEIGEPAKIVWDIPLETREITLPLRIANVPVLDSY
jgi:hypothetical protein